MTETALDGSRSCAGCRQTDAREALLRFVAAAQTGTAELAPDIRRRMSGRGVSVHPRYRCVEAAVRSGAFKRALGVDEVAPARELSRSAADQYRRRAESLLSSAQRARKVALGTDAARRALEDRELELLLVAQDAEGSREELTQTAARLGLRCLVWSNKQDLGRVFGRALLSIVGVTDAGIATELRHVVRCATELAEDA